MGDSKLEIVLLGDAVNTTARIEQACRELDRTFLASADALALINLPNGVESERMPPAALILAPDWACEVLSPATRRLDLVDKRPVYAREGVPHLWLVDPAGRTLEEFGCLDCRPRTAPPASLRGRRALLLSASNCAHSA